MLKTALIIVDVQKYSIGPNTRHIVPKLSQHLAQSHYDQLIFTIFTNQPDSNFVRILEWNRCYSSPDTDLPEQLSSFLSKAKLIRRCAYSALTPELIQILNPNHVNKIYLGGIETDGCVLATAFDLFDHGYDFEILEELCASSEGEQIHLAALKLMQRNLKRQKNITA